MTNNYIRATNKVLHAGLHIVPCILIGYGLGGDRPVLVLGLSGIVICIGIIVYIANK